MDFDIIKVFIAVGAGLLTVFTPCTFPFLPVILGRSLGGVSWKKPLTILISLSISLFIFGIIFSVSLKFAGFSQKDLAFWSGFVVALFGFITIIPESWDWVMAKLGLFSKSKQLMQGGVDKGSFWGDVIIGFTMGPVFTGCSPVLLAILPLIAESTKVTGSLYLIAYIVGLTGFLGLIVVFGQKLTSKLGFITNPHGVFKRVLGVILLVMGVMIMTGGDKQFEAWLIDHNINIVGGLEGSLGRSFEKE